MIHDPALLERLSAFETERFNGEVFRATRMSLDPLAESTAGGRWGPKAQIPVLYTSLLREGALAEISYHWGQLTPRPSKPAVVHRLATSAERKLRLIMGDLEGLGVEIELYESRNYRGRRRSAPPWPFSAATASSFQAPAGIAKTSCSSWKTMP